MKQTTEFFMVLWRIPIVWVAINFAGFEPAGSQIRRMFQHRKLCRSAFGC